MKKNCTDIKQSKKLAEFLPIESADMYYWCGEDLRIGNHKAMDLDYDTPCWSLASLMDVLERGILFKTPQGWACQSYIIFKAITSDYYSNPIDACVDMIEKLHELKML